MSIDRKYKRVRSYGATTVAVHDSQVFEELLHESNSSKDVWADSAYRGEATEVMLKETGYRSHVHRKGNRHRMLNNREQEANRKRSQVRARVEHVFAWQTNRLVRVIGQARAELKIGMMNVVYNMRRFAWLMQ